MKGGSVRMLSPKIEVLVDNRDFFLWTTWLRTELLEMGDVGVRCDYPSSRNEWVAAAHD